jgi:hypothetical protein
MPRDGATVVGVFADLNGHGADEFVLLAAGGGPVYRNRSGHWERVGQASRTDLTGSGTNRGEDLREQLTRGAVSVVPPEWNDLVVGGRRFRIDPRP